MPFWTYQNLAKLTKGTWLVAPDDLSATVAGLWHDTRDLKEGQAYLAIKGDNFDGHDFIDKAFDAGAALAIVSATSSLKPQASGPTLRVDDTVKALQDLARAYRDELKAGGCKVIGIAGSNGKTTTRHLIHHVLTHAGLKGTQSQKSFNNHLGVPLTLLGAKPEHDFVAAEIGTNHPGEIDFLSAIARPDLAVITSIGEEHLEFFGNIDAVAEEEMSIVDHLDEFGDVIAGLGEHDQRLRDKIDGRHEYYTPYECTPPSGMRLPGKHNRANAATAMMVADWFGFHEHECHEALLSIAPERHRGELIHLGQGVCLYDDCYNANPTSMCAAIQTLTELESGARRVAVLGDMYELGERSDALHEEVVKKAAVCDSVVLIGKQFSQAAKQLSAKNLCFEWSDDLPDQIAALLQPGDTVLLKASRGMRLERLIPAIERRFGPALDDEPT